MPKNALVLKGADFSANKVTTITISEEDKPCTGITLDQSSVTVTALGDFTLSATVTPADTTDDVIWTSSDETVATVTNDIVSVVGLGTATITATCGNQTATCTVNANEMTLSADYGFCDQTNLTQYPNVLAVKTSTQKLLVCDDTGVGSVRSLKNQGGGDHCPIVLPQNTHIVELSYNTNMRAGTIMFGWMNTLASAYPETYPDLAALVNMDTTNSSAYNQPKTWTYTVPSGANSFAIILMVASSFAEGDTPESIAADRQIVVKAKQQVA